MLLSQRKYAEHRKALGLRGGSLAATQKAIAAGRIHLNPDGLVDADLADAAWAENTDPAKVREAQAAPAAPSAAATSAAKPQVGSVAEQQLELLTEKTLTARTKRLQLEGDVIRVADAELAVGDMIGTAKNLLLRIPEDLAERLAVSKDPAECWSILEHDIRGALSAIVQTLAA